MSVREAPPHPAPSPGKMRPVQHAQPYPAEKARGAEIILRRPWQKIVFIGGLAGILLLLLLRLAA